MTNQEFADFFAMAQSIPGPNMILMMSFVGWKVWGFPGSVASAFATSGPPCAIYFAAYRLRDRFRNAPWQRIVRLGLVPVTMGLVIASGAVMARAADTGWRAAVVTIVAVALMLGTRLNPSWLLLTGGALGGLGPTLIRPRSSPVPFNGQLVTALASSCDRRWIGPGR
jgi:chromate transporter